MSSFVIVDLISAGMSATLIGAKIRVGNDENDE